MTKLANEIDLSYPDMTLGRNNKKQRWNEILLNLSLIERNDLVRDEGMVR